MANIDNGVMLGALGSSYTRTGTTLVPPKGMIIAAIQPLSAMAFSTLTAENPTLFFNTAQAANSANSGSETGATSITATTGSGGTSIDGAEIPAGMVIYGRWTAVVSATTGEGFIAYFGY